MIAAPSAIQPIAAMSAQVNVENVFDKGYWSTAGNGLLGVGAPRTVKLTLSAAL